MSAPPTIGSPTTGRAAPAFWLSAWRRCRESSCGRAYHRVEPSGQHFAAKLARRRPKRLRLPAHLARIDAGLAELDGMADQPGFESRRLGFQMKLQRELRWRAEKRLHRAMGRRGEPLAARR